MKKDIYDCVVGLKVSIDVSTCDDDAGHRVFGRVTEWQDDGGTVRLLCEYESDNFGMRAGPAKCPLASIQKAADEVVSRVAEWDDRASPEDFPEALLITPSELHRELVRFAKDIGAPAQSPVPMLADVAQVIANGWLRGMPAYDVASEIMREFDVRAVSSTDCAGGK